VLLGEVEKVDFLVEGEERLEDELVVF